MVEVVDLLISSRIVVEKGEVYSRKPRKATSQANSHATACSRTSGIDRQASFEAIDTMAANGQRLAIKDVLGIGVLQCIVQGKNIGDDSNVRNLPLIATSREAVVESTDFQVQYSGAHAQWNILALAKEGTQQLHHTTASFAVRPDPIAAGRTAKLSGLSWLVAPQPSTTSLYRRSEGKSWLNISCTRP